MFLQLLWSKRQHKTSKHFMKSLREKIVICMPSGAMSCETSCLGTWQEDRKLLLTHCASLPRKSRALSDKSWVCGTYLAHSQWRTCGIYRGMSHTSMALYFYGATFGNMLSQTSSGFNKYLQLLLSQFLYLNLTSIFKNLLLASKEHFFYHLYYVSLWGRRYFLNT
jgi:hypothetical protein